MKIGDRGQVTIPKELREELGLRRHTEVEFQVVRGVLVLQKKPKKLKLRQWKGRVRKSFDKLGFRTVDEFIEAVRGR